MASPLDRRGGSPPIFGNVLSGKVIPGRTSDLVDLNGIWNFTPTGRVKTTIRVPGFYVWQTSIDSGRVVYSWWDNEIGRLIEGQPEARYEKNFFIPSSLAGQNLILQFDGVNYLANVYIDDQLVGTHIGGYLPFEFDITSFVTVPSTVTLRVDILYYDSRFLTADGKPLWPFGYYGNYWELGIVGDVRLIGRSPCFVEDVYVQTSVRNHLLTAVVTVRNGDTVDRDITVLSEVEEGGAFVRSVGTRTVHVPAGAQAVVTFATAWSDPILWSPAHPHLYELVSGISIDGVLQDEKTTRFGFREIWIDGTNFMLNGIRTNLRGDNVTAFCEKRLWKYMLPAPENWAAILDSLLSLHINTVRLSVVPPTWMLDLCDEKGMLVIDESAIASRENTPKNNATFNANAVTWAKEWVKRDRNHPSILIWAAENEIRAWLKQMSEEAVLALGAAVTETDPTRPVIYEGDEDLSGNAAIHSYHYIFAYPTGWPQYTIYVLENYLNPAKPTSDGEFDWYGPTYIPESRRHRRQGVKVRIKRILNFADIRPFRLDWTWHPNPDLFEIYGGYFPTEAEILFLANSFNPVAVFDKYYFEDRDEPTTPEFSEGSTFDRTLVIFNDEESATEVTVRSAIVVNDVAGKETSFTVTIPLGGHVERVVSFPVPYVVGSQKFRVRLKTFKNGVERFSELVVFKSLDLKIGPPRAVATLSIQREGNNARLNWSSVNWNVDGRATVVHHYNLYRCTNAAFSPSQTDSIVGIAGLTYADNVAGRFGNPLQNVFYRVRAVDVSGLFSSPSATVGELDYPLWTSARTDWNGIALPFELSNVSHASDLLALVPRCNGVARWDAARQLYGQYIADLPGQNFEVLAGRPYFVNVFSDTVVSFLGEVAPCTFHLGTTAGTSFNMVMVPLDRADIGNASGLMADIPGCNGVAKWNAHSQGYEQYIAELPATDFSVSLGSPLFVSVLSECDWPSGTVSKPRESTNDGSFTACQAPHAVWGRYPNTGSDLSMVAFVTRCPERRLTEKSAGCRLKDGTWVIQCGRSDMSWEVGDTLRVVLVDPENGNQAQTSVVLSADPVDKGGDLTFGNIGVIPERYALEPNFPNPFNSETVLRICLPEAAVVELDLVNALGQTVRTWTGGMWNAGVHEVHWNGKDETGREMPGGLYVFRLRTEKRIFLRKAILLR